MAASKIRKNTLLKKKGFVIGDVNLSELYLTELPEWLASVEIKGRGDFICSNNPLLTSLKNSPLRIVGDFYCNRTGITNFVGMSSYIGGDISLVSNTALVSLEGLSINGENDSHTGSIDLEGCSALVSLEGSPIKEIRQGYFDCSSCTSLTSFKGAPEIVSGNFYCKYNPQITSLEGLPKKIGGDLHITKTGEFTEKEIRRVSDIEGKIYGVSRYIISTDAT